MKADSLFATTTEGRMYFEDLGRKVDRFAARTEAWLEEHLTGWKLKAAAWFLFALWLVFVAPIKLLIGPGRR